MTTTPPGFEPRPPAEILADFDAAVRGLADIDPREVLGEILEDVCSSLRLAVASLAPDDARAVLSTVEDYIARYYGDD